MPEITGIRRSYRKRRGPLGEVLQVVVVAMLTVLVLRTFVVDVYRIQGISMEQTLHSGERLLVNKLVFYWGIREPRPGDIIVFQYPRQPNKDYIKRVVAVAGDKVEIRQGKVFVNDRLLPETATVLASRDDHPAEIVPPNSVWVLGDNRVNSEDSRTFGPVSVESIRGLAFLRIWPLQRTCYFANPVSGGSDSAMGRLMACR